MAALDWEPDPRAEVARGAYNDPDVGATEFLQDAHAAYAHALEAVVEHDGKLLVGMAGLPLLDAAELMRYAYDGWGDAGQSAFEALLRDVLYPVIEGFDHARLSWGTLFADLPPLEKGYDGA